MRTLNTDESVQIICALDYRAEYLAGLSTAVLSAHEQAELERSIEVTRRLVREIRENSISLGPFECAHQWDLLPAEHCFDGSSHTPKRCRLCGEIQ